MKFQVIELRIQVNPGGMPKIEEKNLGLVEKMWKLLEIPRKSIGLTLKN